MLPRERVFTALDFKKPDMVPVEYCTNPVGFYEHGDNLRQLFSLYPADFGDASSIYVKSPDKDCFDSDGRYHEFKVDEWGTEWEYRIYLMRGHPFKRPLDDMENLAGYKLPPQPVPEPGTKEFALFKDNFINHKQKFFKKAGWVGILEQMIALRKFEDVLMDIAMDTHQINRLADMLTDYHAETIHRLLEAGADAIEFGDDYGTQSGMLISPERWRQFFKPRLAKLMQPIKNAGKKVLFHSCGMAWDILGDLKEIGADSIWPQLPLYDMDELAKECKKLGLAVAIHIDRAYTMTHGSPEDVKQAVDAAFKAFRPDLGGSWFYIEVDNGFPFENIETLVKSVARYRSTVGAF